MLGNKFSISNFLILLLFGVTFYNRTILPFSGIVYSGIYFLEIFIFFLFLISLIDFNRILNKSYIKFSFFDILVSVSFLFFIISSFYINFQYNNNLKSIAKLLSYFIVIITFFYILSKYIYLSDKLFDNLVDIIIYFGIFSSLYALFDYFFLGFHPVEEYKFAASGIFSHPNTASILYIILIPILFYKYYNHRISILAFSTILILFSLGLLFTFSRAGYIGVFVTILIMTFFRSKTVFIVTSIFLIFIIFTFVIDFVFSKAASTMSRGMLIVTAVNMVFSDSTHFLWGYGVFNAIDVFITEKIFSGNFENVVDPHNVILLLTIQFGALFTISVLISIIYLYIKALIVNKKLKSTSKKSKLNVCIAITLGLIVQNLFEDQIVYPEYFFMPVFLIFFGYIYYSVKYEKDKTKLI